MNKIQIPDTDLKLSPLGMGCVNAGLKWEGAAADRMFDAFYDAGGNVYDTARVYSDWIPPETGRSERVIGEWLQRSGKRNRIILVTKGGHPDMCCTAPDLHRSRAVPEEMRRDLELSLRTLGTDYIDLYFFHRDNENLPVGELMETMEEFVREGKIRYYGCSNWSTERMREADAYCREKGYRGFAANQALYNIGQPHMKPPGDDTLVLMDRKMYKYHAENPGNLAMPYTSTCGGFFQKLLEKGPEAVLQSDYYTQPNLRLAEKIREVMEKYHATATQVVLGFLTCQEFCCLPLYGPRNEADIAEAMGTFEIGFCREDYEGVEELE
ncbi:MAG: aldo/keto reductase [Clostridiales bacterium]|nr:aldo/keto reductase [Clostridiales bacterium]